MCSSYALSDIILLLSLFFGKGDFLVAVDSGDVVDERFVERNGNVKCVILFKICCLLAVLKLL